MKRNILVALSMTAAMVAGTAHAAKGGVADMIDYWGAGASMVGISGQDSGYAIEGMVGKKMDKVMENFRVEGVVNYTVVPPKWTFNTYTFSGFSLVPMTIDYKTSVLQLGGFGVYEYPVNKEISVRGKAGLAYQSMSAELACSATCPGTTSYNPGSQVTVAFGVGALYALDKAKSVMVEWVKYDTVTYIAAGVKFSM